MGIIAGGRSAHGHGYTLADASWRGTPARKAIRLYDHCQADVLVAEVNNGGEWIGTVVQFVASEMHRQGERATPHVHYKTVHASRGKLTRAEPISTEYEHGRFHHVGYFPQLESEQTGWVPGMPSPSRMDALVWVMTELVLGAHVPRDLSLFTNVDLRQPSLDRRAAQPQRTAQPHDVSPDAEVRAAQALVWQQWSINALDDYEEGYP